MRIAYVLNVDADVVVTIRSALGARVWRTHVRAGEDGGRALPCSQAVVWDGRNEFGRLVGTGAYVVRLEIRRPGIPTLLYWLRALVQAP